MSGRRAKQRRREVAQRRARARLAHPAVQGSAHEALVTLSEEPGAAQLRAERDAAEAAEMRAQQRLREQAVAMLQEEPPAPPRRGLTKAEIMSPGPLFPWEPWGHLLDDPAPAGPEPMSPAGWAPEHTEALPDVDVTAALPELVPA